MLNILLSVLKVIGILLAILFGLLLFLFLLVTLGPITYKASGAYKEEKYVKARVNWLGFILRYKITYEEDRGMLWWLRVFGILIASNEEEFIQKKEECRLKKEEAARKKEARQQREQVPEPLLLEEPMEQPEEREPEKPMEQSEECEPENSKERLGDIPEKEPTIQADDTQKEKCSRFQKLQKKSLLFRKKIRKLIHNIKSIPAKIRKKIENLRAKMDRFYQWKEFLFGEQNREGFQHTRKNLKKMILHILPVRIQGRIEFGLEDPYVMGQVLTVLSIFYPVYQDKLTLVPHFEEPGFAAEGSLKGRIIPGYLLLKLLIIICNREVRRIIGEGRQLIGGNES